MHAHSTFIRSAIAIACTAMLAACGNGSAGGNGTSGGVAQVVASATNAVMPDSHGSASVRVDGQTFRFKVVQCEWDFPHPILKQRRVELTLTGVHPDTPQDVAMLLATRPDANIDPERTKQALATAFAHGPTLSITRLDDGMEVGGMMTSDMQGWSASDGELTITGGNRRGARVSGRMKATQLDSGEEAQLELEATCP